MPVYPNVGFCYIRRNSRKSFSAKYCWVKSKIHWVSNTLVCPLRVSQRLKLHKKSFWFIFIHYRCHCTCEQVMSVTGWYLFGNTFIGVMRKAIALIIGWHISNHWLWKRTKKVALQPAEPPKFSQICYKLTNCPLSRNSINWFHQVQPQ